MKTKHVKPPFQPSRFTFLLFYFFYFTLLVGVLLKTLIFGGQSTHDGLVARLLCVLYIVRARADWVYWLMDSEPKRMPKHPFHVARPGHDFERTVDGERHNRQLQFIGKHESTAPESSHVTRKRARSLGEYNE